MLWVTLPLAWNLGNARAVTTLLISLLCIFGIWVLSYFRWKHHAAKVNRQALVGLFDLLVVSSPGDAMDTTTAVFKTGHWWTHVRLLLYCALVVVLSIIGIAAGPIARYTIGYGFVIRDTKVPVAMATIDHTDMRSALVQWNSTINRLHDAGFPYTELLDFLPDTGVDWQYKSSQWNSSWTMSCEYTPLTEHPVKAKGIISKIVLDEIPDVRSAYPSDIQEKLSTYQEVFEVAGYHATRELYKDILLFVLLSTASDAVRVQTNNETMRMTFLAFHLHNIPRGIVEGHFFGIGPAEYSAYTRADCVIRQGRVLDPNHIAYLWTENTYSIARAYSDFYQASVVDQSINSKSIYHPTGRDLIRFFQAYMITKDTQYQHVVSRTISVRQRRIRIALIALLILIIYVIVLVMLLAWAFIWYPIQKGIFVPRTKVDWVMEVVREVSARDISVAKVEASREQFLFMVLCGFENS
ncbi:uncharacterized protein B0J16DRAFT_323634 [Fusarium flagelliforme]|uniref:uncharacterized protein n=1 Tax=Fusarium flagelliforme TaxID=2675880 RepID=UPI001E8CB684|nr:uncharacterized protein B0J16DRAFT_323634 [Fusarium flagelliforme]KAH7174167.1 hypothetical protein B0J16DRAFT_323634 [Fusarium flagelliforme]